MSFHSSLRLKISKHPHERDLVRLLRLDPSNHADLIEPFLLLHCPTRYLPNPTTSMIWIDMSFPDARV
jgi:hypothetical protein